MNQKEITRNSRTKNTTKYYVYQNYSAKIEITVEPLFVLKGILFGDTYNQSEHGYGVEIKAVSYHLLEVISGPPSKIKFILDL